MHKYTIKVEPVRSPQVGGYLWVAYVYPVDGTDYVERDYGYSVEGAILNVLYGFASYCVKNSLTSDCIEEEQRNRLQVYIEQINGANSQ